MSLLHDTIWPSANFVASFIHDLGRWRSILNERDRQRFDQLAGAVWDHPEVTNSYHGKGHTEDLYYFQELIQNLVQSGDSHRPAPMKERSFGSRLRNLQVRRDYSKSMPSAESHTSVCGEASFHSIGSILGRLTVNDEAGADNFDLADFIHLDKLEGEGQVSEGSRAREALHITHGAPWRHVDSGVVLLLASVAFTVVLIAISGASYPSISVTARAYPVTLTIHSI